MELKELQYKSLKEFERKINEMMPPSAGSWDPLWETFEHRSWAEPIGAGKSIRKHSYRILMIRDRDVITTYEK